MNWTNPGVLSPPLICKYCGTEYTLSSRAIFGRVEYCDMHHCQQKREGTTLLEIAKIAQNHLQLKENDCIQQVEPVNLSDLKDEDWEQIRSKDNSVGNSEIYACWRVSLTSKERASNLPAGQAVIVKTNSSTQGFYRYVVVIRKY